jgi:hypothetical protein
MLKAIVMPNLKRSLRFKNITEIARQTWSRIWPEPMPPGWKVYLVRKTVIQNVHGRQVCGVTLARNKTILIGRNTGHYSFETLVHELAHVRTLEEQNDHGPMWQHEFNSVARTLLGNELSRHI